MNFSGSATEKLVNEIAAAAKSEFFCHDAQSAA
jgi:hypothetical protein